MATQNFNNKDINTTGFRIKCKMTGVEYGRSIYAQSSSCLTRGAIRYACRFFTLMCGILMTSTIVLAQEVETCANGAGTIITGVVTGNKYCKSNNSMNWWNAYAWCDAVNMNLVDLSDCGCIDASQKCGTSGDSCPNLFGFGFVWLNTPSSRGMHHISINGNGLPIEKTFGNIFPVCKN